jgi:hypothetical protein
MAWYAVAALVATAAVGCASGGKRSPKDDQAVNHDVAIEVNNNLTLPTVITVYLVAQQGARTPLGDVPGAQTRTFTFRPYSYSDSYRLLAVRQLANSIRSQSFNVGGPEIGTISWALIPNIVSFYNLPEELPQDTGAAAAKPPATK